MYNVILVTIIIITIIAIITVNNKVTIIIIVGSILLIWNGDETRREKEKTLELEKTAVRVLCWDNLL